jgi:glycosyltransferase involved in cell wall biosynthesis
MDSIFGQTFQEFELILLDDASTDNSNEIIKLYENHSKVSHTIRNIENSGSTFRQWKTGIELAKGDFIWIAESDDYNSENFLEESLNYLKKMNIGLVFNKTISVNEEGKEFEEITTVDNGVHNGIELLKSSFSRGNLIINGSSVVFKKNLVLEVLKELPKFQICGDWLLWSTIAAKENIGFTDSSSTFYRQHPNSITNKLFENTLFFIEAIRILSLFKKLMKLSEDTFRLWLYRINNNRDKLNTNELIWKLIRLFGVRGYFYFLKAKLS